MRISSRHLASAHRYLTPYTPTGLTGLHTHPAPRSTLIYLYSSTLQKLSAFPASSAYRQSVEALTNHRLEIVKSVVPPGYEEWLQKARQTMKEHPEAFTTLEGEVPFDNENLRRVDVGKETFIVRKNEKEVDLDKEEWDGEENLGPELEGIRTTQERKGQAAALSRKRPGSDRKTVQLDEEPQLTVEQIEEIENKIGAGLIEEVIQVAEGETQLASLLLEAKVWEDLEEQPAEGQWTYFPRDTATPTTQKPPQK